MVLSCLQQNRRNTILLCHAKSRQIINHVAINREIPLSLSSFLALYFINQIETTHEKNVNSSTILPAKAWMFILVSQSRNIYKADRSRIPNGGVLMIRKTGGLAKVTHNNLLNQLCCFFFYFLYPNEPLILPQITKPFFTNSSADALPCSLFLPSFIHSLIRNILNWGESMRIF